MYKIPGYDSVMEFSKEIGIPYMSVVNAMKRGYCKFPRRKMDGITSNAAYKCWEGMISRCTNPNATGYEGYGGRGIKVCSLWLDFRVFLADMGERPGPKYSIERIDNSKGYSKDNCKWATSFEQARNKRCHRYHGTGIEKKGKYYRFVHRGLSQKYLTWEEAAEAKDKIYGPGNW